MTDNPYEAPVQVAPDAASRSSTDFRWKTLPVGCLAAFGGIFVVGGIVGFVLTGYGAYAGEPWHLPKNRMRFFVEGLCIIAAGCWLLWAARVWWQGRWKLAIAMCVLLFVLSAVAELVD